MQGSFLSDIGYISGVNVAIAGDTPVFKQFNNDFNNLYTYPHPDCISDNEERRMNVKEIVDKTIKEGTIRIDQALQKVDTGLLVPVNVKSIPIKNYTGEIVGVIQIINDNSVEFDALRMVKYLQGQMRHDQLTGTGNRIGASEVIETKLEELRRYKTKLALLFIDVDNFKVINDTFGHETGDRVLSNICSAVKGSIRNIDYLGRWGGEEFVVVTPYIEHKDILTVAERIRMSVQKEIVLNGQFIINSTVSIGVAYAGDTDTVSSLVARADSLMYQSKNDGKNRITIEPFQAF